MQDKKGDVELKSISLTKRLIVMLLITLFALCGCNTNLNDIKGSVYEIQENSIIVEVFGDDPEAQYPAYEIFVDDYTVIEGVKNSFDELKVGDNVEVWVENSEIDERIAKKISVFDVNS